MWVNHVCQNHETIMKTEIIAKPIRKIPLLRPRLRRIDGVNIDAKVICINRSTARKQMKKKIAGEELI